MSGLHSAAESARRWFDDCERFVRSYTAGIKAQDLHRLFDRDAVAAYDILSRDQESGPEPGNDLQRVLHRARVVFLGLSFKLTPARRLLFVLAVVAAVAGLLGFGPEVIVNGHLLFDWGRVMLFLSAAALAFLLTLELVDQIRVRDELEVARQLQADLLPTTAPELPGYEIAHAYRTANEVGGDYYDFPRLPDGRIALMVGDASGHGMAAGLLMAIANASIKLAIDIDPSPLQVLTLLNRTLCRTGDRRAFMSLFCAVLEPETGALEYVSAGHPFPLLRRRNGAIEELGSGSLPLGVRPELELKAEATRLMPGDLLVAYSDGLPEAADRSDTAFGYERLKRELEAPGTPEQIRERYLRALDEHLGGAALADDFSIVIVGRNLGATPPPPPPR